MQITSLSIFRLVFIILHVFEDQAFLSWEVSSTELKHAPLSRRSAIGRVVNSLTSNDVHSFPDFPVLLITLK